MEFDRFVEAAEAAFNQIPVAYREGIDGLVVSREAEAHPDLPDVWTLGTCETEQYPSDWMGPDTVRSVVRLYYGSFLQLSKTERSFDWTAEIHETVEHEVRHHLEWLAGGDDLGDVDAAMDESFKRFEGMAWDPWFYQKGEEVEPGVYAVEDQAFVELRWSQSRFDRTDPVTFGLRGETWQFRRPDRFGDLHFVHLRGLEGIASRVEVVLVRERRWWEWARRALSGSGPEVLESEANAQRVAPPHPGPDLP